MKKTTLFSILLFLTGIFSFFSCKKQEGYGGNGAIKGVLKMKYYNSDYSTLKSESVLQDTYVYIVFQDGKGYGDRVKTSYDGSFSFTHLQKGNYKIFAYSQDTTLVNSSNVIVSVDVKISKNKELVDVGDIKVSTNVSQTGNGIVRGKILATHLSSSYYATNEKVYIVFQGDQTYSKYVFTDDQGEYEFTNVPVGTHKIYAYSKNLPTPAYPAYLPVEINFNSNNDLVVLGDLQIEK